jgi:primosomal protein N' (replication factor Y)
VDASLNIGSPVRVPLRNKLVEGIVIGILEKRAQETFDVKKVKDILGNDSLLSTQALQTAQWMSDYYLCSVRSTVGLWLPPAPWSSVLPKDIVGYRLTKGKEDSLRGKKQIAVLEYLSGVEWAAREDVMRETGASSAVLATLEQKGMITLEKRKEEADLQRISPSLIKAHPVLTPAQEAVYNSIVRSEKPTLLFGVTGSGKTEIYAKLIADAIATGKQAILLLPEILLTEHFIHRFEALLERETICILHSRLSEAQRRKEWKRIHSGQVSLIIGSRSALFAPCKNLGVVILDEEHEWTYKNEQTPRYHARDTAEVLCRLWKAKLVLGSATPSLESWAKAKSGRYMLARLPMRYKEQPLPKVKVVDLADVQFGNLYPFSPTLIDAIRKQLQKKEQTVLFLNRRGVASSLLCLQCRRRIVCPESQLPYTLHHTQSGRPFLLDHTTGIMADVPPVCPHCNSTKLHAIGAGTQRIEILLQHLFPSARLLRADKDTLQDPKQMRGILEKMKSGAADILLGTQSVVKGLDLPNVTLAAVMLADVGLSLPHFRAGERIFQLLTQLTGRSGRAKPGEVIIQTFRPTSLEVLAAANHETEKYLENELKIRIYSGYPPATHMVRLIVRGEKCELLARKLHGNVIAAATKIGNDTKASVSPTLFGGGKVWHVLMRGSSPKEVLPYVDLKDAVVDIDAMETI